MTQAPNPADDHAANMKQAQKEHRQKVGAAKDPGRGLILVHTGNGKGKSTSAFGVAVRALGWGHRVGVVQFIKGKWDTGEKRFFERFPELVTWRSMGEGFTWDTQDKARDTAAAETAFEQAREMLVGGAYHLIILDEINVAMRYGYLAPENVLEGLRARSKQTSVILTGRDAGPEICREADLVSEIGEVKHPFHAQIKAQQGIDF
jgi:cob(I)alamin adenosyltransferase